MTEALVAAVWLSSVLFLGWVSLSVLLSMGATALESIALAAFVAVYVPALLAEWAWFVPLGALKHVILASFLCVGLGVAVLVNQRPARPSFTSVSPRSAVGLATIGIPMLTCAFYSAFMAVLKPVDEWDALTYHGPTVVKLVTERTMFGWDIGSSYGYYTNLTAFMAAPIAATTHSTRWMDAVQVAPWVVLVLTAWAWAGRGRVRVLAGAIVLVAATAPPIWTQLRSLAVDVTYGCALFVSAYCVSLWIQRRRPVYVWLGVIALGSATAAKPTGAILLAFLVVGAVVSTAIWRQRSLRAVGLLSISGLIGSPLYARNLIEFGNPVYPIEVTFPIQLDGRFSAEMFLNGNNPRFGDWPRVLDFFRNLWEGIAQPPNVYTWDLREGGYDRTTLTLLAVAVVVPFLAVRGARVGGLKLYGLVPVLLAIALLIAQPTSWYPRYTIASFVMLATAVALFVTRRELRPWVSFLTALAVLLGGYLQVAHTESRFVAGFHNTDVQRRLWPGFGDTFAASGTYGDSLSLLMTKPCGTKVFVQANDDQRGRLSTFSLGLWGNQMCNEVRFLHGLEASTSNIATLVHPGDFIVVAENDVDELRRSVEARNLRMSVVGGPIALLDLAQVVALVSTP